MYWSVFIIVLLVLFWIEFTPREVDLDANATTRPHAEVICAMNRGCLLGNPSAYWAREAAEIVEKLKQKLLSICGKNSRTHECIITSGCSESNNLLFRGFSGSIWCSGMEHKTSIECVRDLGETIVHGWPHPDAFAAAPPGSLVSVMAVNNETGDIFDFGTIAAECRRRGVWFHSDISQFLGKYNPKDDLFRNCDALSGSAHKLHGPAGIGFLIVPRDLPLRTQISGTQNSGLRGGTYNTAGCYGFLTALDITLCDRVEKNTRMRRLIDLLWRELQNLPYQVYKITRNSYNTLLVSFQKNNKPVCNLKLREWLTSKKIKVSIGSACNVSQAGASHVLHELGLPQHIRSGTIRFSVSDYTTTRDVLYVVDCIRQLKY